MLSFLSLGVCIELNDTVSGEKALQNIQAIAIIIINFVYTGYKHQLLQTDV